MCANTCAEVVFDVLYHRAHVLNIVVWRQLIPEGQKNAQKVPVIDSEDEEALD